MAANRNNSVVVIHINTYLLSKEHIFSCSRVPIEQFSVCMQENGDAGDDAINRGVQYPFSVNEKVIIKVSYFHSLSILSVGPYFPLDQYCLLALMQGNRRTPEKFVGKEAVITSQCLNGW